MKRNELSAAKRVMADLHCEDCGTEHSVKMRPQLQMVLCGKCSTRRHDARLADTKETGGIQDAWAGVISERLLLFSFSRSGRKFGPKRPWSWNPRNRDPPVHIHGDGHSTAHTGHGAEAIREPEEERLIRQAGLDREEAEILRRQARQEDRAFIAHAMHLSLPQVKRRIDSLNRKIADLVEAIKRLNRGGTTP